MSRCSCCACATRCCSTPWKKQRRHRRPPAPAPSSRAASAVWHRTDFEVKAGVQFRPVLERPGRDGLLELPSRSAWASISSSTGIRRSATRRVATLPRPSRTVKTSRIDSRDTGATGCRRAARPGDERFGLQQLQRLAHRDDLTSSRRRQVVDHQALTRLRARTGGSPRAGSGRRTPASCVAAAAREMANVIRELLPPRPGGR